MISSRISSRLCLFTKSATRQLARRRLSHPPPPSTTKMSASDGPLMLPEINFDTDKYPFCIVWTPIPVLSWFFPFIGHMGIALSSGVIRDFAGPYYVSEDSFAFGRPARYLRLDPRRAADWDEGVSKASVVYGTRMHNLFCDNCHSHVAMALGLMRYDNRDASGWNMVRLAAWMFVSGRYVGVGGVVRTWLPFVIIVVLCCIGGFYL